MRRDHRPEEGARRGARGKPAGGSPLDRAVARIKRHPDGAAEDEAQHARPDGRMYVNAGKTEARHQQDAAYPDAADQYPGQEGQRGDEG